MGKIQNEDIKSQSEIQAAVLTTTGNTHSNTTLDNLASTAGLYAGLYVYGSGIPPGTTIGAPSGSSVTMSQAATTSLTGTAVTFGGQPSQLPNDTKVWLTGSSKTLDQAIAAGDFSGLTWTEVTGTTQSMVTRQGYIANNASQVVFTLPSTASLGQPVAVVGKGAGSWRISQQAGQSIVFDTTTSQIGTVGFLSGVTPRSTVELVCVVANTQWQVRSYVGSISIGGGFGGSLFGYSVGGNTAGGGVTTLIERLTFSGETIASTSHALVNGREQSGGCSSFTYGYSMGSNAFSSTIEAMAFSDETTRTVSTGLDVAKLIDCAVTNVGVAGYGMGGQSASARLKTISKILFSGEVNSVIANQLNVIIDSQSPGCSTIKGYAVGGLRTVGGLTTQFEALTYSGETVAIIAGVLSAAKRYINGVSSTTKAYLMGGINSGPTAVTTIEALTFSGEAVATLGATLPGADLEGAGISSTLKGYAAGGWSDNFTTRLTAVYALTFSGETTGTVSNTLSVAKAANSAMQI